VTSSSKRWLALAMLASFLAAGIPFWVVPYDKADLPNALWHPGLFVAGIAALMVCMSRVAPFWRATVMITLSICGAVLARVMAGIAQDPTSHNLWPFEMVIAFVVGLVAAAPGALAGSVIARWRPTRTGEARS